MIDKVRIACPVCGKLTVPTFTGRVRMHDSCGRTCDGAYSRPAQGIETAQPPRRETGLARKGESPVGIADAPKLEGSNRHAQ